VQFVLRAPAVTRRNRSSVLNTERQQYADILAANDGDINVVIAYIRKRIAAYGSSQ
jgi:hypothetical protein